MTRSAILIYLLGLASGIAIAWLLEAVLAGPGVVSRYLGPIAFGLPVLVAWLYKQ